MKLRSVAAAMLFLAAATPHALAAKWEGVFEGRLGKSAIIVELNAGMDKSEYPGGYTDGSRYSYLPKAYDLKLLLEKEQGSKLEFQESTLPHYAIADLPADDPGRTGRWSLTVSSNEAEGTWTSQDGKKSLPIRLKRLPLIAEAEVPKDFNRLSLTYNKRWFEEEKISGTEQPKSFGTVTLALEKDSAFNVEMPVFTAMPDTAVMQKANALLRDYYRNSLMQYRDCVNGRREEPEQPIEPEYAFEITYATPRVLTIEESGSIDCGGAHPNNYVNYLTFDLLNGKQIGGIYERDLKPEGFGEVLKLASKDERIAFEKFALKRWEDAAKAAGDTGDESCSGAGFMRDEAEGEKEFSLAFDPKGLAVHRTDFPSVAANCLSQDFNPTIIPWAELKPWLKPGQQLLKEEVE